MLGIHYTFFDKVNDSLGILGTALRVFRYVDTSGFSILPKNTFLYINCNSEASQMSVLLLHWNTFEFYTWYQKGMWKMSFILGHQHFFKSILSQIFEGHFFRTITVHFACWSSWSKWTCSDYPWGISWRFWHIWVTSSCAPVLWSHPQ